MDSQRHIHDMVMRFKFVRHFIFNRKKRGRLLALSCFPLFRNTVTLVCVPMCFFFWTCVIETQRRKELECRNNWRIYWFVTYSQNKVNNATLYILFVVLNVKSAVVDLDSIQHTPAAENIQQILLLPLFGYSTGFGKFLLFFFYEILNIWSLGATSAMDKVRIRKHWEKNDHIFQLLHCLLFFME